ncbi:hypothetical protein Tco_0278009 [Tanacetum coccineum]
MIGLGLRSSYASLLQLDPPTSNLHVSFQMLLCWFGCPKPTTEPSKPPSEPTTSYPSLQPRTQSLVVPHDMITILAPSPEPPPEPPVNDGQWWSTIVDHCEPSPKLRQTTSQWWLFRLPRGMPHGNMWHHVAANVAADVAEGI